MLWGNPRRLTGRGCQKKGSRAIGEKVACISGTVEEEAGLRMQMDEPTTTSKEAKRSTLEQQNSPEAERYLLRTKRERGAAPPLVKTLELFRNLAVVGLEKRTVGEGKVRERLQPLSLERKYHFCYGLLLGSSNRDNHKIITNEATRFK